MSCELGIDYVGFTMLCFGVVAIIASYGLGVLEKWTGQYPIFVTASVINAGIMITMLLWKNMLNQHYMLFVITGLWGATDSIWQSQTVGKLNFKENKIISNEQINLVKLFCHID